MTALGPWWQRARTLARSDRAMLPALLAVLTLYLVPRHTRSWIPHDEGVLAQTAERVLRGEWPHLDFDDPYTGGLALLHALAMRVFGTDLVAMRRLLLLASLGFGAVLYRLARRIAEPWLAAFLTCVAMAWGVPNYFAALPSWYNLFAASLMLLCLLRAAEHGRARDVALAGVLAGLSVLVKVIGVFHVAAGLLCLLFMEQARAAPVAGGWPAWLARAALRGSALVFAAALTLVLPVDAPVMERLHFTLPGVLLAAALVVEDLRLARRGCAVRLRPLFANVLLYLAGVALPIGVFLYPYVVQDGLHLLLHDVFVAPQLRVRSVSMPLPPLWTLVFALPIAVLVLAPTLVLRSGLTHRRGLGLLASLLGLLVLFGATPEIYFAVWMSLRPLVPVAATGLLAWLPRTDDPLRRVQLFCVIATTVLVSLVQFPYSFGIYFLYCAPLVVIALAFVTTHQWPPLHRPWLVVACFFLAFAVAWQHTSFVNVVGARYLAAPQLLPLALPRAGLEVPPGYAIGYTNLVRTIEAHSAPGTYIYAAPDCPEVYFLSGRRNPTRTFYDLFDPDFGDRTARAQRILERLEQHDVAVVVVCNYPEFSGPLPRELATHLEQRYPKRIEVPPLFTVRIRDRAASTRQHSDSDAGTAP